MKLTKEQEERRNSVTSIKAMFYNGICASSGGVIVALLQEHCGVSYGESGLLLSLLSIGQFAASYFAGILPGKIGMKRTAYLMTTGVFLGYGLMTLAGAFGLMAAVPLFMLSYALIGIGKGATLNIANLLSAKTKDPAKNLNLEHAGFALGSLLSPVLIALFGKNLLPWWMPILMLTVFAVLLYTVFLRAGLPDKGKEKEKRAGGNAFLKNPKFWLIAAVLFCQQGTEIGVTGWLVTYFKDTGILGGSAGQMTVSVIWGAMLIGRLLIAFKLKIKRIPRAIFMMGIGCTGTYLLLLSVKAPIPALLMIGAFGFAIAGVYPMTLAAAGEMLTSESMAVLLPLGATGAITMPSVIGAVAAGFGIYAGMATILFCVILLMLFGFLLMRYEEKH